MGVALILCIASAACYNAGVVLQSAAAFGSGEQRILRPSLFTHLVRVRSWVVGTLLSVAGWVFQVWALTRASLTFVQPVLGGGVFFLLAFTWLVLGNRPTRRDGAGAAALAAGIVFLSIFAPVRHTGTARATEWIVVGVVLGCIAVAPLVLRATKRVPGPIGLAVSVGFAFSLTGLSSEVVSRGIVGRHPSILVAGALVTAAFGSVGFLSETSALVSGAVTAVVPVMVLVQTALPVALAPFLFGERWPHSAAGLAGLLGGLVLAVGGAVALAASRRVTLSRLGPPEPGSYEKRAVPRDR